MSELNTDSPTTSRSRSIIELSCEEAKTFFLKQESYCSIDLPPYFHFNDILQDIANVLKGKKLSDFGSKPKDCDGVNHLIFNNKDGKHAWRPWQLINPAIYVSLVNLITQEDHWRTICDRFGDFAANEKIKCMSLPIESLTQESDRAELISHWWKQVEQASIELALDYDSIIHTDIIDCYSAIYTHSIAWALHTKEEAKKQKNRKNMKLIGNIIDCHIQDMRNGQTNGIPQGSVLMDFIAEIVLGYADSELSKKLNEQNIENYQIIRYRDDYRIFVNSSQDGDKILKCLTEVLIELGFKLNPSKTKISNRTISSSIKEDKLSWICRKQTDRNLQKYLLLIHQHSLEHPNTGSLVVALNDFYARIKSIQKKRFFRYNQTIPLISIVVDIAYHNPRTYPVCVAILSKFLSFLDDITEKERIIAKIKKKFSQIPNIGYIQIWLQRACLPFAPKVTFDEPLCKLVLGEDDSIWNCDWIEGEELKAAIKAEKIIDHEKINNLDVVIPSDEIEMFISKSDYN